MAHVRARIPVSQGDGTLGGCVDSLRWLRHWPWWPAGSSRWCCRLPRPPPPCPAASPTSLSPAWAPPPPWPSPTTASSSPASPAALRVVQNGTLLATPAVNLSAKLCSNSERGLLGVAVDPAFATNGYVFLYYSFDKAGDCGTGTVNRVSRFVMTGNTLGGEVVRPRQHPVSGRQPQRRRRALRQGRAAVRERGRRGLRLSGRHPQRLRRVQRRLPRPQRAGGKILRIDRDGNVPPGNPFTGAGTARCNMGVAAVGQICQETFAWGLRNPFRIAFDSNAATTRFHINDVGQGAWEEIDLGAAGADYGWNVREGHCANGSVLDCGPAAGGHDQPHLRLRPGRRLPLHHRRGLRAQRHLARRLPGQVPVRRLRLRQDLPPRPQRRRRLHPGRLRHRPGRPTASWPWASARPAPPRRSTTRPTPAAARSGASSTPGRWPPSPRMPRRR